MKKIKHDRELIKLAKRVMNLPFNQHGTDKSFVYYTTTHIYQYFREIRKSYATNERKH